MTTSRLAAALIAVGLVLMFVGVTLIMSGGGNVNEILFLAGLALVVVGVVIALRRATAGR